MSTQNKGKRGGARPGAGRKPNTQPPAWPIFQIGVVLTPEDLRCVQRNLTPMQRRYRLVYPWGSAHAASRRDPATVSQHGTSNHRGRTRTLVKKYDGTGMCKPANLRIACRSAAEKDDILRLTMPERRFRLLTIPPTGDVVDSRPGRWVKK
jgi:hypothetical protein